MVSGEKLLFNKKILNNLTWGLLRECGSRLSPRFKSLEALLLSSSWSSSFAMSLFYSRSYNAYNHKSSSDVCSQTAGLIWPPEFIRCEVMSTLVPAPSGVYFRHVLTAWSWFQIHKPSDKCSPHFPNYVPTCSPPRSPPPPILFFSCVHVCFYRQEVTSSQLSFLSLPLAASVIYSPSCCLQT